MTFNIFIENAAQKDLKPQYLNTATDRSVCLFHLKEVKIN